MGKGYEISKEELELISRLEKFGWVYGYLSGHGDAERVTKTINDKTMCVADVEKTNILCPPYSVYEEPYEEEVH